MPDIVEIIGQLLSMTWTQFKWMLASFAALGLCALIAEVWPFGGDKTQVANWTVRIAMAIAAAIYLYVRFLRKPPGPAPR